MTILYLIIGFGVVCLGTGFMLGWLAREYYQVRMMNKAISHFIDIIKRHSDHVNIDKKPIPTETPLQKSIKKASKKVKFESRKIQ